MRFDKFTIKSQELIQNARSMASKHNNQQIEPEHLLLAMLNEPEGIARAMLDKLGVSSDDVSRELDASIDRFPKVSGSTVGDAFISPRTKTVLDAAFAEAAKMKDQYVSIEHIFLSISDEKKGEAAKILREKGISRETILKVLLDIRGTGSAGI